MTARRRAWAAIRRIAASDRISGLIMLGCAILGLVLANLPATAHLFETVAETHLGIPGTDIDLPLGHWAQDGLLTIFFLTVGAGPQTGADHGLARQPEGRRCADAVRGGRHV